MNPAFSVIVDLEATCCNQGSVARHEMEIIEIGAVAVAFGTGEIVSEFQAFVRPVRRKVLTEFCRELTSITQDQVSEAETYPVVHQAFREWLSGLGGDHEFCSWGAYDKKQFEQDCAYHKVPYPFVGTHRNLKAEFTALQRTKKRFGLGQALRKLGFEFEGTPHRGIDDARNIARVYEHIHRVG